MAISKSAVARVTGIKHYEIMGVNELSNYYNKLMENKN